MTIIEVGASASVPVEESGLLVTDIATSVKCQHGEPPLSISHNINIRILDSISIANTTISIMLLLLLSRFSRVQLCATPETAAHQASRV